MKVEGSEVSLQVDKNLLYLSDQVLSLKAVHVWCVQEHVNSQSACKQMFKSVSPSCDRCQRITHMVPNIHLVFKSLCEKCPSEWYTGNTWTISRSACGVWCDSLERTDATCTPLPASLNLVILCEDRGCRGPSNLNNIDLLSQLPPRFPSVSQKGCVYAVTMTTSHPHSVC